MPARRFDAIVVGGGHNGLVAAALLARAGWSVLVLERRPDVGGAAASQSPFPGVDARLSRYAYLVSLFPPWLMAELAPGLQLRERPEPELGPEWDRLRRVLARLFGTLTEPLRSREQLRALVGDPAAWEAVFERPLSDWHGRVSAARHAGCTATRWPTPASWERSCGHPAPRR